MPPKRAPRLIDVAIGNAGPVRGAKAITFLACWAIAENELGHTLAPGQGVTEQLREYRAYWHDSERTVWRDLAAFRKAFPGEDTPRRLAAAVRRQSAQRQGVKAVGALSAPRLLAA